MIFLAFLFLLAAHFFCGNAILQLFRFKARPGIQIPVSLITGVAVLSLIPFVLELCKVPLTFASVLTGIIVLCAALNIPYLISKGWKLKLPRLSFLPSFKVYEWPFMILLSIMMLASVWRAYYLPPNARDMLSGPEVIAEYAVKEHTMINSVLSQSLETTNNHLKPPFITGLQIIYKLFGFYFGQVWLSIIFVSFTVLLYNLLRERIHPMLACILLLFFSVTPELYGYTYVMLFDYSNMVLFFLGFYMLHMYFLSGQRSLFFFSALIFGLSTHVRSETLVLVGLTVPLFWFYAFRNKIGMKNTIIQTVAMAGISFLFYFVWVNVFLRYYMPPGSFSLGGQINKHLEDLRPLFKRFTEMNTELLFGKFAVPLWGYFIPAFLLFLVSELLYKKGRMSRESRNWMYGIGVVYFGLPLLGYALPLVDLLNTTKRGLFKLFPFMILIMANNPLFQKLSLAITRWESEKAEKPAAQKPVRQPAGKASRV
jgi:hypothetical protein